MRIAALAGLMVLGCAAVQPDDSALYARAHAYEGGPVTALMAKLGVPDSEKAVGPAVWYGWSYSAVQGNEYGVYSLDCKVTAVADPAKGGAVAQVLISGSKGGCRRLLGRL